LEINMRDMTINADALSGIDLDYEVARITGMMYMLPGTKEFQLGPYRPSTDWRFGGPLIEKHHITVFNEGSEWRAGMNADLASSHGAGVLRLDFEATGDTALQAAMRCLVKRGPDPRPAWEPT